MFIRWQNYKSFYDTNWIEIKPITILLGNNGAGKTSILQPLLLLKQTIENADERISLMTQGDYVNLGTYSDLVKNHDLKKKVTFSIRFLDVLNNKVDSNDLGSPAPNEVCLTFDTDENNTPQLLEYQINNTLEKQMVKRTRGLKGNYDLTIFEDKKFNADDQDLNTLIIKQQPKSFLFFENDIVQYIFEKNSKNIKKKASIGAFNFSMPSKINMYFSAISYINNRLNEALKSIKYIGPIRDYPKRIYEYRGESHDNIGSHGQYLYAILNKLINSKERKELSFWLNKFNLADDVICKRLTERTDLMEISVKPIQSNLWLNFADTCFGVSQILPLIAQCIIAKNEDIVICEQPEIHLNPECELLLGDFFVNCANEKKANYIIESHSEHMLLRIRKLIRMKKIKSSDVALYYTSANKNDGSIIKILLDDAGNFSDNNWPKGFLEQGLSENMAFVMAK